jgi:hypothetical protein
MSAAIRSRPHADSRPRLHGNCLIGGYPTCSFRASRHTEKYSLVSNKVVALPAKRRQAKKPRHQHTGRVFILYTFALIILMAGIYFGPQTVTYWRLRLAVLRPSDTPPKGWSSVPKPLAQSAASASEGTVLSYYGHRFEVPWKDRDREWDEGRWIRVSFKTGQTIIFINPAFQHNPISAQVARDEAFVPSIRGSKYQQYKAVISATPSQWSPFRSRKGFARVRLLLEIKGLLFEHNEVVPDIFSFETKSYRGFEISGLSHDWQDVMLNLFDLTDHWFQISILGDARSGVRITQSEINRLIQSFGPAP